MSEMDFSDPATIALLTAALEAAGVDGIEIERPGQNLRIVVARGLEPIIKSMQATVAVEATVVRAPMAGEFLTSNPSRKSESTNVPGFIRVGPILLPLPGVGSGQVLRYLVEHGAIVGFGDALFEVETE
ncbi:acetyl-CoA carboxylase [Rhizobium sp. 18055]|uniref:acetyl-CoA carboxylase n=1 Tax=Rhizobium sp. 18055 TaxID=2681403 RepID=UPI001357D6ED|nr:acetyl-CoA carboxylase [Rhizobium sp. 18055]